MNNNYYPLYTHMSQSKKDTQSFIKLVHVTQHICMAKIILCFYGNLLPLEVGTLGQGTGQEIECRRMKRPDIPKPGHHERYNRTRNTGQSTKIYALTLSLRTCATLGCTI